MRNILFITCLFLSACLDSPYRVNNVQALANTTNTAQPTRTPIPTATIGYQQTAEVAQSTADEARRVNAQATAQHEAIINQQLLMTQAVEQQDFMKAQWTAEAATVVIPLTATQQAIMNTQIPLRQTSVASQLTATEHAPTQMVALIRVANEKEYGQRMYVGQIVMMWAIAILSIGFIGFLFGKWLHEDKKIKLQEQRLAQEPKSFIPEGMYKEDRGQGSFSIRRKNTIPCTREQFTEFAECISDGTKTMGINEWEGTGTLFTRDTYIPFHSWLRENGLAVPNARNGLDPTNELLNLLEHFLDTGKLPNEYQFAEEQHETE